MFKGLLSFYKPFKDFHLEMFCQQKMNLDSLHFKFSLNLNNDGTLLKLYFLLL
jgi:hypothetical protein